MSGTTFVNWASHFSFIVASFTLGACDANNTRSGAACPAGEERCACYPNKSCNDGLTCLSNVCVNDDGSAGGNATSSGGSTGVGTGTGGGAAIAAGGTSTEGMGGGATSVGGIAATGGSSVLGSGGSSIASTTVAVASGGSVTTGGTTSVGNGGSVVTTGGAVATGGTSVATLVTTGGMPATGGQPSAGATGNPGPNLIKDGTFQAFETYWNAILQEGDSGTYTRPPTAATVCVTNTSTSSSLYYELSFTIGYPNAAVDTFVIDPGATYTLSYTVSATNPISFEVKIGHSVSPWTEVYKVTSDVLSSSYKTFSHQFTSTAGDTSAGLAFNVVLDLYGKMCFQQVSLTKN